jgi:hypothetical protein
MKRVTLLLAVPLLLLVTGCAGGGTPSSSPPGSGGELSVPGLKVALLERLGELWFCDPDEYPVGRDEVGQARLRFPEIAADETTLRAIVDWIEIERVGEFTPEQQLLIYRAWKVLNAIQLTDIGNGRHRFDILTKAADAPEGGLRTAGIIDASGAIEIQQQEPAGEPACPICLARGTRIATPHGEIAVEDLRVGDLVWSVDASGRRAAVPVARTGSTLAPLGHRVVRLDLADGRSVTASPSHPLGDGRRMSEISVGDVVDGSPVIAVVLEAYQGTRTFDILPRGATGRYWANGVLLGSTIGG